MAFGCVNNTIRLRSGLYLDLADPQPDQFRFADISGALAKICRFGGQCDAFYSVAEHSVHCSNVARDDGKSFDVQRACLLHDAAEAFVGDIVKPLKVMLPEYREVEKRIERVIADKYRVSFDLPEVREIDMAMLIAERRAMFSADKVKWCGEDEVRRLVVIFRGFNQRDAELAFYLRARELDIETEA